MNQIKIIGGSAFQKRTAKQCAEIAITELMPRIKTLNLEIAIRKFHVAEKDIVGWCLNFNNTKRSRHFGIVLNREQSVRSFIHTIMHEMVHVKQYVQNELKEVYAPTRRIVWMGQEYSDDVYSDAPWEIEARMEEDYLFEVYMDTDIQ